MYRIKKLLTDRKARFNALNRIGLLKWTSDEWFIKKAYYLNFGKRIDLVSPKTFNEKLQWLKLHDRKDIYTVMVDKFEVKKYVAGIIGDKYIIPTIGVYDSFDDINFDKLPNQFVIKCTHDSGGLVIVKDKTKMDKDKARNKINKCLRVNYYYHGREWPYKNVRPRIIIEKYMSDLGSDLVVDYKFFCFNGEPRIVLACSDRFSESGLKETWFDDRWNMLPVTEGGHDIDKSLKKPNRLDEMKRLAKKLSNGIAFVRIDFYEFDRKVYFGEITFFPASGYERFNPEEWNRKLGDMLKLTKGDS